MFLSIQYILKLSIKINKDLSNIGNKENKNLDTNPYFLDGFQKIRGYRMEF